MHTLQADSPSRKIEGDSVRRVVNARKSRKHDERGVSFKSSPHAQHKTHLHNNERLQHPTS